MSTTSTTDPLLDPEIVEALAPLNDRQRLFVGYYVGECRMNATSAFRKAGYTCSTPGSAYSGASVLLRNTKVRHAVDLILERQLMTQVTALSRMALMASASIDDAVDGDGYLDISKARETGAIHFVKEIHVDRDDHIGPSGDITQSKTRTRVKMYDAQAALKAILQIQGQFKDKGDSPTVNITLTSKEQREMDKRAEDDAERELQAWKASQGRE